MNNDKLRMLAFHITPICENKCEYCYMGDVEGSKHPPYQNIEKILEELAKQGLKSILLGGGNPCTYPHLEDVVKQGFDLGFNIEIISNTLHFRDYSLLKYIQGLDATILGHDSKSHDDVAQRNGAYHQLMINIKKVTEKGYKIGIVINATPHNYNKIFETIENIIENENIPDNSIKYVMIQRVIPKGRASNTQKYGLKKEHIGPLFDGLEKIKRNYGLKTIFEDTFPLCLVEEKYHKYLTPCVWGFAKGSINWNGDVSRCGADSTFGLGNILKKPLRKIWNESPDLLSYRGINWLPKGCKKCSIVEKCRCGCPLSNITECDHGPDIL